MLSFAYAVFCSGQAAVITPRQVNAGLSSRRVMAVAAAKHHTVIATESGEVFTWGSNRGKDTFLDCMKAVTRGCLLILLD